jgi:peroxiredoxin
MALKTFVSVLVLSFCASLSQAAITVGQAAPDFSAKDAAGKVHKLSDYKGKYVVLEWTNPGCPYVQKHYRSQNMQNLQKAWTQKNVAWLAVNSTNPGHSDYQKPDVAQDYMNKVGAAATALLMDSDGKVGSAYAARNTPHMFVVDPQGKLIYAGAIDDKRSTDEEDVKTAKNYIAAALSEAMAGKAVSVSATQPYGCSIKY